MRRRTCRRPSHRSAQGAGRDRDNSGATGPRNAITTVRSNELVTRSLITLKALTYAPTGGIVAAPTTSLPEWIGGVRNWDYRFCWLRDATLTLLALMNAGYYEEAAAWRDWLLRAVAGRPEQVQIMYGIARRAPAGRMGSAVAAGLSQLAARSASATRAHNQLAARRLRRGDGCAAPGPPRRHRRRATTAGPCRSPSCSISRKPGPSPTKASGRCAADAGTSPIRR